MALAPLACGRPAVAERPPADTAAFRQVALAEGASPPEPASATSQLNLSPEALQIAEQLKLVPGLIDFKRLKERARAVVDAESKEALALRLEVLEQEQRLVSVITQTSLEIDTVMARIDQEQAINNVLLRRYSESRDRTVALTNAASFVTNGALWAVAEALDIPTWNRPKYSISSGAVGILAGLVPTAASLYALKEVGGHHYSKLSQANILAKLFGYEVGPDIDYPDSVWTFLNTVPPGSPGGLSRRQRLMSWWTRDKLIPGPTSPGARRKIGILTAETVPRRSVTIAVVSERLAMLEQLTAVVFRAKELLLEIIRCIRAA